MRFSIVMLILLMLVAIAANPRSSGVLQFRKKTLSTLNSARRMIASGDIRKILEVFKPLLPEGLQRSYEKFLQLFGPASRMYKLVWNRKLERASFDYAHRSDKVEENMSVFHEDYVGFYWVGDLLTYAGTIINFIPKDVKEKAKTIYDFIEGLIILFLIIASWPNELPLKRGDHYGPAELMYGDRFEIGCHSNILYSVCFVKKMEYQPQFFEIGVSCFKCPDSCEFWEDEKTGEYEEGDLCVPPQDFYTKQISEAQMTDYNMPLNYSFVYSFLVTLHYYLFIYS